MKTASSRTLCDAQPLRALDPTYLRLWTLPAALTLSTLFTCGCSFEWEARFHEQADERALESVSLRPTEQALSFFRVAGEGGPRLFGAVAYEARTVRGVDLSAALGTELADPIDAFNAFGYEALAQAITANSQPSSFDVAELILPVELNAHHIAAGTNFPEHAEEAGVEDGPYLFPKLVEPTRHDAAVSVGTALLDYEVEVGWVPLEALREGKRPEFIGLVVCNDYTDRDVLLRLVNTSDVASGAGFTTAKSFPGYLPVGNLFVIPKDYRAFDVQLKLYVNGWLRQREWLSRAVWQFDEMLDASFARKDRTWAHRGAQVSLFSTDDAVLPARTLLLSGTPPGVVFNELGIEHKASGFFDFVLFGWNKSIPDHAIDNYIRDARAAGIYLHAGDEVTIHVDGLGVVRNELLP